MSGQNGRYGDRLAPTESWQICTRTHTHTHIAGCGGMGKASITYKDVLEALNRKAYFWTDLTIFYNTKDTITLKDFRKILIIEAEIARTDRKVRELWSLMQDLDFFVKMNNSSTLRINLEEVAKVLHFKILDQKETEEFLKTKDEKEGEKCQPVL